MSRRVAGPSNGIVVERADNTDIGNARRLEYEHGEDIRFLDDGGRGYWRVWDGKRWVRDELREVQRRAQQTALAIFDDVRSVPDREERDRLAKHAITSQNYQRIRAMIHCAEALLGLAVHHKVFDSHPWMLNVENGTVELRTGTRRAHCRRDMLTALAPVPFEEAVGCPRWEAFVREIMGGDREMVAYLQRAVGYSLTGVTTEQVAFILHGSGANGKTTFLELLHAMLGDYAARAATGTFCEQRDDRPRPDIARLAGKRFVTALEIGEGRRLSETVVKSITGGDTVTARELYEREFEFRPQFKVWMAANHKPVIRATDLAMWRRVHLIPFEVTFDGNNRDDGLSAALRLELPGILRWAIDGCQAWLEQGLRPPARVAAATESYRKESDVLGSFIDECCETNTADPNLREPSGALYRAYRRWSESVGEHATNETAFGRQLTERRFLGEKVAGQRVRLGIRLRSAWAALDGLDGLDGLQQSTHTRARMRESYIEPPTRPTRPESMADASTGTQL